LKNWKEIAMPWQPGEFVTGVSLTYGGKVPGYLYKGLALKLEIKPSPKGRRPAMWSLFHIRSGHQVATIHGDVRTAFPIATEIADTCDWSFGGLRGYLNQEPDLLDKVRAWAKRHGKLVRLGGGHASEDVASAISRATA
jgi:hypothetical protein